MTVFKLSNGRHTPPFFSPACGGLHSIEVSVNHDSALPPFGLSFVEALFPLGYALRQANGSFVMRNGNINNELSSMSCFQ